jgi:hypothetical protein
MDIERDFPRALRETRIHRRRNSRLLTVGTTELPYILMGESLVNVGDTVIRSGIVRVEQPNIVIVHRPPHEFNGFEESEEDDTNGAMVAVGRMASFPPGKYSNIDTHLEIFEGSIENALEQYMTRLDRSEDASSGLLTGPVDIWPMSLMVYVGMMVAQSASADIQNHFFGKGLPRHWS